MKIHRIGTPAAAPKLPPDLNRFDLAPDLAAFRSRHSGNLHATLDPLYDLPEKLLDALVKHVPGLLTEEQQVFEQDLITLCSRHHAVGIFHGAAALHHFFKRPAMPNLSEEEFREHQLDQFMTLEKFNMSVRAGDDRIRQMLDQLEGYVGWLITNPVFLAERDELKNRWGQVTKKLGNIPAYPVASAGEKTDKLRTKIPVGARNVTEQFTEAFNLFYKRWNLRRLATWDLPEPLEANLGGPAEAARFMGLEGPSIQLSPVLRLPARLPVREILEEAQAAQRPKHLAEWAAIQDERHPRHLNTGSFRRIFWFHYYRNVVLASRYAELFKGNVDRIDAAFAAFAGESVDTVKKMRLRLGKLMQARD